LHGHRPLFVSPLLNRVMDVLCCLPAGVTAADMREQHVIHHHRFNDGPQDISCTEGYEHGPRAIWYWIRHHGRVKMFTLRTVFAANPSRERRKRRFQAVFDYTLFLVLVGVLALVSDFPRFMLFVAIPYAVTLVCTGYFAWLTHAPARGFEDDPSKSMNNVNNILNFLTFNQGYHSVHHRYPGIHWSQIPDKLDFMRQVQPAVIVPYWMTPISAWRLVAPSRFLDAAYGEQWKSKLEKRLKNGSVRARYLPWFAWI
jgi:fatty acid desaturase